VAREDEETAVRRWRREHLLELGVPNDWAFDHQNQTDVVHQVERLVHDGCPLLTALRIADDR
jgi:hypothetical protein